MKQMASAIGDLGGCAVVITLFLCLFWSCNTMEMRLEACRSTCEKSHKVFSRYDDKAAVCECGDRQEVKL